jgi:hypothetical protein
MRGSAIPELPVISDAQNTTIAKAASTPMRFHVLDGNAALLNIDRFTLSWL